jgi:hypothetical protein
MVIYATLSKSPTKKFKVVVQTKTRRKTIHFGAQGYEDFTIHKDLSRKKKYIARHKNKEDWTRAGIFTAGYWSKHLLWNKPSLHASIKDLSYRHQIYLKSAELK